MSSEVDDLLDEIRPWRQYLKGSNDQGARERTLELLAEGVPLLNVISQYDDGLEHVAGAKELAEDLIDLNRELARLDSQDT